MRIFSRVTVGLSAVALTVATAHLAGAPLGKGAVPLGSFSLTVDSIMRGPKLVGYPPTGLRWAGDSSRLYFEWRRPGEDEASTWVVTRDGSDLRKLSDDERRSAPPVNGAWDKAHRRVLFVDQGDIVLVDSVSRRPQRRAAHLPRHGRHERAVPGQRPARAAAGRAAQGALVDRAVPGENHGFEEETSWADEYKRILTLFDDNLKGLHDARRAS